jgi:hypothetical protein
MNPRIGLTTPVKAALGEWLVAFHGQAYPDTPAFAEWAARTPAQAMAWAPGRMVDQVSSMLSTWKRNDNSGRPATSAYLPVMFLAVAADYTETPGEAGRPLTDYMPVTLPGDTLERSFKVRVMQADLRAQVVAVASDPATAQSMMGQLCEWAKERRRFDATYGFIGFTSPWPVQILAADRLAVPTPEGEHVHILTLDLTVRAAMPMFYGPKPGDDTDGNDPPGFAVLNQIAELGHDPTLGPPSGVSVDEWRAFRQLTPGAPTPADTGPRNSTVVLWPAA